MVSKKQRLLAIDGLSMIFRSFYAMPDTFRSPSGAPTNAIFGFVKNYVLDMIEKEAPTHIAVAFDVSAPLERTRQYPEYKAGRPPTPPELSEQIPVVRQLLEAMGIAALESPGNEADDILATLASQGSERGWEVLVLSGDRDAFQLIDSNTTVLYPGFRGTIKRMNNEAVFERYGVDAHQYPDVAALVGEKADNLPGVPGVGEKTAVKWLNKYGSLDEILANRESIGGKVGQNLRDHHEDVVRNRKLNRLDTGVDYGAQLEDLVPAPGPWRGAELIFNQLGMNSVKTRAQKLLAWNESAPLETAGEAPQAPPAPDLAVVDYSGDLAGFAKWLADRGGSSIALSLPEGEEPTRLMLATTDGQCALIDLVRAQPQVATTLAIWLETKGNKKVVHGAKDAAHALAQRGFNLRGVAHDTQLAAYLVWPDLRGYDLVGLAAQELDYTIEKPKKKKAQTTLDLGLDDEETREEITYLGKLTYACAALRAPLEHRVAKAGATKLLEGLEMPVSRVLYRMERTGIGADREFFECVIGEFEQRVARAQQSAWDVIDREVNLSSPAQLQDVLFDQLGMPKTKKIKTGYSTNAEALADMNAANPHPFLDYLLEHRDAIKLAQIAKGLRDSIDTDGRIHTTFQQSVAATGRLSSRDPNLQNIPARTPEGLRLREGFTVGEGYECLLTADYSQIEMRIMAHLSGDQSLIEAFNSGEDLHTYVAAMVYRITPEEVTSVQRSSIKAMSYGLVYGLSAFGLGRQLGISSPQASEMMRGYFQRFGAVKDYLDGVVAEASRVGYTETIMGRRRYLPDLASTNGHRREIARRAALNAPIQGSAADIIKVAMLRVEAELERQNMRSRVLLQVHDELVCEVAPGEREALEGLLRQQMAGAHQLSVPLEVSVGAGANWREAGH